jgi:hypothetical protein
MNVVYDSENVTYRLCALNVETDFWQTAMQQVGEKWWILEATLHFPSHI